MDIRWSFRNLRRHPLRTALSVAGIAVASAMLCDMIMLRGGLETSFESLLLLRGYQVRITPEGTLPFDSEATIPHATMLVDSIAGDAGVASVAPVVATSLYGAAPLATSSLVTLFGYGIDPANQGIYQLQSGTDLAPGDSTGVLLGEPAAALLAARIGDTLSLVARLDPQVAEAGSRRTVVVRGIVRWLYDHEGQPSIGTIVPVMQSLGGIRTADRVSVIMVKARDGAPVPDLVARIRAAHRGIEVSSVDDMVRHFRDRMVYFTQLALILGTLSLGIATLLIGTLLAITVNERLAEIATLRALGVSRQSIVRDVLVEGLSLTLAGGALGLVLGLVTARLLDRILTSFPGLPAAFSFFVPRPGALATGLVATLLAGVVAGIYPAWLASRAPIAATLRAEAT
jgi:putative ABC transport system permease protein